uniref:amidohydrolase family protein n=1 Tax=Fulvivirga sp. TaxID=1931237 RepID=UPI0040496787
IDSHVHLNNIAGIDFRQRRSNRELVDDYFERLPKNFLYFGYTTLIDVDNYAPETIARLKASNLRPEIYTCGQKMQVMDDFEMAMNEYTQSERYVMPFLHDRFNDRVTFPDSINLEQHTPSHLVEQIASEGNICIKTLYEDASSGLPVFWELPSSEIISELVKEAHAEGLPVVMHATSYEGQKFALQTNVDVIAHAMWNWTSDPESFLNTDLPETHRILLEEIASKGVGYQPTFRTILAEKDILDGSFKYDPILKNLYTINYLEWLQSEDAQLIQKRILGRPDFLEKINPDFITPIRSKFSNDEELFEEMYKSFETKIKKVVQILAEQNANLLFSTDHGALNMYTHPAGYNGYLEMKHWLNAGVSLELIFKAATYNNAKQFNLLGSIGTLKENKTANILILNSDPLKNIKAYNDIQFVMINGRLNERRKLSSTYEEH